MKPPSGQAPVVPLQPENPTPENPAMGLSLADRLSLPRMHWVWLLLLIGLGVLAWASRSVAGPFIAGFILAYLLDPVATRLQRLGGGGRIGRSAASALVLVLAMCALVGLILASAPIIEAQIVQLIERLPGLIDSTLPLAQRLLRQSGAAVDLKGLVEQMGGRAVDWATTALGSLLSGSLAFVNVLNFLVVTPIVAFYLLRDWAGILRQVESWWPRRNLPEFHKIVRDADTALGGFVRGQSMVCLVLAVFYAIGWSLVGLDYALVLGVLAGVFGFVPFLGVIVAVALSLMVAIGQFGLDWVQLLLVFGVFQVGQILESAILTPNLIGDRIGLHPVWVLFSVFAGGAVAGLAGVFLAVPVAAVLGVVVRAALTHYRRSSFYGGYRSDAPPPVPPPE
ncbi:AI-2E family transporter [Polymorphobacter sp.]|uniref:AI-2E family transporter n=1 Tax=Polymorphobacter sp. TaxID=1909290 RepID=UPI003F6E5E2C